MTKKINNDILTVDKGKVYKLPYKSELVSKLQGLGLSYGQAVVTSGNKISFETMKKLGLATRVK